MARPASAAQEQHVPRALNVWKPANDPMILSAADSGVGAFGPFVAAGRVYATLSAGLIDLDAERLSDRARRLFRDPECGHGTVVKDGVSGCRGAGAAVDGDRAFVARSWEGVQVFDLSMAGRCRPSGATCRASSRAAEPSASGASRRCARSACQRLWDRRRFASAGRPASPSLAALAPRPSVRHTGLAPAPSQSATS
ncbi:MAG: hypothetical protein IPG72_14690 [Ardenticatenales bacterium]|jgi:hypothetical protein|nr:hypothetical protein [Ardenticatenales bacterium]